MAAQAAFFRGLARGAGSVIPAGTAEAALGQLESPILSTTCPEPELARHVGEVCHRIGLTLTRARNQLTEAVELVETGRPVLIVVRREDRTQLIAIRVGEGTTIRAEVLDADGHRVITFPRDRFVEELGVADPEIASVFRVRPMGGTDQVATQSFYGRPLRRLWDFLTPDRAGIWIVVGSAIGLGILTLATPIAAQALVNFLAFGGLMQPLIVVGALLLFFLAFAGAIRVFKFYIVEILQRRVFVRVVSDLSARLPRVRVDAYDKGHGPELVNRFFDVLTVQKAGSALLIDGLDIALQATIGLFVLGFYHPILLMFDVALVAAIVFILLGLGRGAIASARRESDAKYKVASALEELANAPTTYKLAGAPEFARSRLAGLASNYITARRGHFGVVLRQLLGAVTLHAVASTALLTLGGWLVINEQLTLGQLVAAELIVSVALQSFVKFGKQLEAYYDLMAGVDKLGILFDLPTEEDHGESHVPGAGGAELELRDVTYHYPSGSTGIEDFSLRVAPNERVAVRGTRRSGKSTLADLVSGLAGRRVRPRAVRRHRHPRGRERLDPDADGPRQGLRDRAGHDPRQPAPRPLRRVGRGDARHARASRHPRRAGVAAGGAADSDHDDRRAAVPIDRAAADGRAGLRREAARDRRRRDPRRARPAVAAASARRADRSERALDARRLLRA